MGILVHNDMDIYYTVNPDCNRIEKSFLNFPLIRHGPHWKQCVQLMEAVFPLRSDQELGGGHWHTRRQQGELISLLLRIRKVD
jgi:hypothetical protein